VLTVARLVRQKRVHVLLAAMALLAARLPDALLVVVGDGPERAALAQRAAALGSGARVEFVGRVPPLSTALYDLYSRAQVVAMAGVREGLSNVLMEAGALGRPGVGADDGGTPEVIRDGRTGLLARRDDPADFARCLEELLRDPARAEAMGRDARAWIRAQFGLPALVERANAALRRVLAARDVA